ncbi:quinone-dependent dihydroorotate dehydrogenase [Leptospira sp. GIMC2001]|uniref:quinone-dependent dihydroorotate dehydrogenase n=1 Tax=Leptospira sp. GIMC2001 TaxID=1513297 RepID=UPI00234BFDF5|nr:quinone-dependent dihydroorotate dehydrogenase [Leptospira sp. GIMC2001]WCL49275.1 quinone-dependent dihydroorotate dehydrogenase [Leptospira sp. GIMC2001]
MESLEKESIFHKLVKVNRNAFYSYLLKPLFFRLSPENAHELAKGLLELGDKFPFFLSTLHSITNYSSDRLVSTVAGIKFENPLGMAAGFDKTGELYPFLCKLGFGHIEIGTVTGEEQLGNPRPRLFRYPEFNALINRMGFNNPGAEKMNITLMKQPRINVRGINAGKTKIVPIEDSAQDYAKSFRILGKYADYGVINISSPNTPGLRSLQGREAFRKLFLDIKQELGGSFDFPIFVKFAPDLSDEELLENLQEALDLKISGVILTNTTLDKSSLGLAKPEEGGLSGVPLRDRALHCTRIAYKFLQGRIPIIGVGGIDSGASALERIQAGANIIQIYTSYIYQGPFLPWEINKHIDEYLKKSGKKSISEIVGEKNK